MPMPVFDTHRNRGLPPAAAIPPLPMLPSDHGGADDDLAAWRHRRRRVAHRVQQRPFQLVGVE